MLDLRNLARQLVAEIKETDAMMYERDDELYERALTYLTAAYNHFDVKVLEDGTGRVMVKEDVDTSHDPKGLYRRIYEKL